MATTTDIKNGLCINFNNDIYTIVEFLHVNLGTAGEGIFQHTAGLHVTHFGAHKSGTFARFDVQKLYDGVNIVVEIDAKSVLDIGRCCHK